MIAATCPACQRQLLPPDVRQPHCTNTGCPWTTCRCGATTDRRGGLIPAPKARKK